MTRILGVARSGFYAWRTRQGIVSTRAQMRHQLDVQVAETFAAAKGRCGAIRITKILAKQGAGATSESPGVIIHSDRGSQYCSHDYQALLNAYGLRCSMSAKGNCYDNACSESFFHSLKVEAIHGERFTTRAQMWERVFEYIEVDYNRHRLHSTLVTKPQRSLRR